MRRYQLTVNGKDVTVDVGDVDADRFQVRVGNESFDVTVSDGGNVECGASVSAFQTRHSSAEPLPPHSVRAPMPGLVLSVDVVEGALVTHGQALLTLEAMKMRNSIRSPRDGVVRVVHVTAGQNVGYDEALVEVTPS